MTPLSSPSRSFKSCAPWELVLSEPWSWLIPSGVLFAICSTNAIRAEHVHHPLCLHRILDSFFIGPESKFTRNCNCKPTIRLKYGFFRVSMKILIISFSSRRGHARGRHFSPPLGVFSENLAALLLHSLTVKAVWFYLRVEGHTGLGRCLPALSNGRSSSVVNTIRLCAPSRCLRKSGSTRVHCTLRSKLGHLSAGTFASESSSHSSHCSSRIWGFGRHCHVGELGHTEGICVPKELRPRMSRIFSSESSILLSNWGSLFLRFW
uniref:Uncharacterized protein n=1 Tax=Fagus sylvatica TaxID=28930 RepID=A0A2N9HDF2_FAGSY